MLNKRYFTCGAVIVVDLYNKNNTFYLIAASLATLASVVLITVFNAPTFLTITLAVLSSLVIMFLYKIMNDRAEINGLAGENKGLKQQLESEKAKAANAQKKIQDLENIVQDKEIKLCNAKNEMQSQKIDMEKKVQDLKGLIERKEVELIDAKKEIQKLRDKIQYKEMELTNLLEKVKKESSTLQNLQNEVNILNGEKLPKVATDYGEKGSSMNNGEEVQKKRHHSSPSILSPRALKRVYDSIK